MKTTKISGKGIKNLKESIINKLLEEYPYVNSFEELCELRDCKEESVSDDMREYAEKKIKHNLTVIKMNLRKQLKDAILLKNNESNIKALITLYQLIADEDELRRLGTPNMGKKDGISRKSEITIKSADSDILNKLSDI